MASASGAREVDMTVMVMKAAAEAKEPCVNPLIWLHGSVGDQKG